MNQWAEKNNQENEINLPSNTNSPKRSTVSPRVNPKNVYGGGYNGSAHLKKVESASVADLRRITSHDGLNKVNT
jgi:hypothetical protein